MKNESMVEVDLAGYGINCSVTVPAEMFFELLHIIPEMIDRIGFEDSEKQYFAMLAKIKSQYQSMPSLRWGDMDEDTEVFLRMCQMIAVLGSYLHDIALKLSGDGIADYMTQVGGINVTKQVEAGLIPVEQFH
ncbi:MAG: hypothetical protein Q8R65_05785 [Polynucleobacter sp.]|nr:hypothetical protein [Polynucleobacter sp.]